MYGVKRRIEINKKSCPPFVTGCGYCSSLLGVSVSLADWSMADYFQSGRKPQPRVVVEREGANGRMVAESTSTIDPATGELVEGADGLLCEPGHEFGEYVRRVLPRRASGC